MDILQKIITNNTLLQNIPSSNLLLQNLSLKDVTTIRADSLLSNTSTNAVLNKIVTEALNIEITNRTNEDSALLNNIDNYSNIESITYSELKSLRDSGKLILGKQYRIIDYQCTTILQNTKSANHLFDIIVTATSINTLNEEARACLHSGDTYFSGHNLNAWKLWYCINNDTNFLWADTTNGKGIIYRMIDEYNNDCPYDFKNILFIPYYTTAVTYYVYTFSNIAGDGGIDNSLTKNVFNNTIKRNFYTNTYINYISLIGNSVDNYFGDQCEYITLESDCGRNWFLSRAKYIVMGSNSGANFFGDNSKYNVFGNLCFNNTFGSGFLHNTLDRLCASLTVGNSCTYNTFGKDCQENHIGNYCNNNNFGNDFLDNIVNSDCSNNILKDVVIMHSNIECTGLILTSTTTTSESNPLKNLVLKNGISGSVICQVINQNYQWTIAKDSNGNIIQYCEDDLKDIVTTLQTTVDSANTEIINITNVIGG